MHIKLDIPPFRWFLDVPDIRKFSMLCIGLFCMSITIYPLFAFSLPFLRIYLPSVFFQGLPQFFIIFTVYPYSVGLYFEIYPLFGCYVQCTPNLQCLEWLIFWVYPNYAYSASYTPILAVPRCTGYS